MLIIIRNFIKCVPKIYVQWLQNYMTHQHSNIIRKKTGLNPEVVLVKSCQLLMITSQSSLAISSIIHTAVLPVIRIKFLDRQFPQSINSFRGTPAKICVILVFAYPLFYL